MCLIDLVEVGGFLKKAEKFNSFKKELSFFDVGLRGHFENPTTELLWFFLDPSREHGLGESFINGFLSVLKLRKNDVGDLMKVDREVVTNYGRIDLLLVFEKAVFVVECKINHAVNNPFEDYQEYVEKTYPEKIKNYILLSPEGKSYSALELSETSRKATLWLGISYRKLAEAIKKESKNSGVESVDKWKVLADELLLQFYNYGSERMTGDQFDFVLNNFLSIEDVKRLQQNFYDEVLERVRKESFDDVKIKQEVWGGVRVLRFSRMSWSGGNSCVIYFSDKQELPLMARVWARKDNADVFIDKLRPKLKELNISEASRCDNEKNWARWDWHFSDMDITINLIAGFVLTLNEMEIRGL